jgi:hypothetical protein
VKSFVAVSDVSRFCCFSFPLLRVGVGGLWRIKFYNLPRAKKFDEEKIESFVIMQHELLSELKTNSFHFSKHSTTYRVQLLFSLLIGCSINSAVKLIFSASLDEFCLQLAWFFISASSVICFRSFNEFLVKSGNLNTWVKLR